MNTAVEAVECLWARVGQVQAGVSMGCCSVKHTKAWVRLWPDFNVLRGFCVGVCEKRKRGNRERAMCVVQKRKNEA